LVDPAADRRNRAIVTIVTNDYLFWARALFRTVRAQYGGERACLVYVIGAPPPGLTEDVAGAKLVRMEDLRLPAFWDMAFRYTPFELCNALKPRAVEHALAALGYDEVIYLDSDIILTSRLDEADAALTAGACLVATPHITAPHEGDAAAIDLTVLRSGRLNAGFLAARRDNSLMGFLGWWSRTLETACKVDHEAGYFVDQTWLQHAPGFLEGFKEIRHPGYNVGHWNLAQRMIAFSEGRYTANGLPLRFFHRSGADLTSPELISSHGPPIRRADLPALDALLRDHDRLLAEEVNLRALRYDYARLRDGTEIPPAWRRAYALNHPQPEPRTYDDVFAPGAACNSPAPDVRQHDGAVVTALMHVVWRCDATLQARFDLDTRDGQLGLSAWLAASLPSRLKTAEEDIADLTRAVVSLKAENEHLAQAREQPARTTPTLGSILLTLARSLSRRLSRKPG
jgi:hypothetical protein